MFTKFLTLGNFLIALLQSYQTVYLVNSFTILNLEVGKGNVLVGGCVKSINPASNALSQPINLLYL
jgi:hypothetical protein